MFFLFLHSLNKAITQMRFYIHDLALINQSGNPLSYKYCFCRKYLTTL